MVFSPICDPPRFFFKNRALSLLYPYGALISCKKLEKTNERSLRYLKTDTRTDGHTHGQSQLWAHRWWELQRANRTCLTNGTRGISVAVLSQKYVPSMHGHRIPRKVWSLYLENFLRKIIFNAYWLQSNREMASKWVKMKFLELGVNRKVVGNVENYLNMKFQPLIFTRSREKSFLTHIDCSQIEKWPQNGWRY